MKIVSLVLLSFLSIHQLYAEISKDFPKVALLGRTAISTKRTQTKKISPTQKSGHKICPEQYPAFIGYKKQLKYSQVPPIPTLKTSLFKEIKQPTRERTFFNEKSKNNYSKEYVAQIILALNNATKPPFLKSGYVEVLSNPAVLASVPLIPLDMAARIYEISQGLIGKSPTSARREIISNTFYNLFAQVNTDRITLDAIRGYIDASYLLAHYLLRDHIYIFIDPQDGLFKITNWGSELAMPITDEQLAILYQRKFPITSQKSWLHWFTKTATEKSMTDYNPGLLTETNPLEKMLITAIQAKTIAQRVEKILVTIEENIHIKNRLLAVNHYYDSTIGENLRSYIAITISSLSHMISEIIREIRVRKNIDYSPLIKPLENSISKDPALNDQLNAIERSLEEQEKYKDKIDATLYSKEDLEKLRSYISQTRHLLERIRQQETQETKYEYARKEKAYYCSTDGRPNVNPNVYNQLGVSEMSTALEILGAKDNSEAEIKKAYNRQIKKWHPDINKSPLAQEVTVLLTWAKEKALADEKMKVKSYEDLD